MNDGCRLERQRPLTPKTDQYNNIIYNDFCQRRSVRSKALPSQPLFKRYSGQETRTLATAVDVGIVIALKEEFAVLYEQIAPQCVAVRDQETGNYTYHFVHASTNGAADYHCVVTFVGQMGALRAGLITQKLLHDWKPATVVMLGIAAALDNDIRPGDVIIANQVDAYLENTKAVCVPGKQRFAFQPAGEVYRASSALLQAAQNFEFAQRQQYRIWQKVCVDQLQRLVGSAKREALLNEGLLRTSARIHIGHLASGPTVGASYAFKDWLKVRDRKYLALEMESAGFLTAAYEQGRTQQTLVLRTVSDFGDERKSELDKIQTLDTIENGALRRYGLFNVVRLLWSFLDADLLSHASF